MDSRAIEATRFGRLRCTTKVSTPTAQVRAAKKYQAERQPSGPPSSMMRGTIGPVSTSASDDPELTSPEARPRRLTSNQADMRATDGTSTMPPPSPVMRRAAAAETTPSANPVISMPPAATSEPMPTTSRGPKREASMPPTAAMSM